MCALVDKYLRTTERPRIGLFWICYATEILDCAGPGEDDMCSEVLKWLLFWFMLISLLSVFPNARNRNHSPAGVTITTQRKLTLLTGAIRELQSIKYTTLAECHEVWNHSTASSRNCLIADDSAISETEWEDSIVRGVLKTTRDEKT